MFEFRCTIRIIARRTWYWALSWIIPYDDMIVRICMCPESIMICIMSFNGSSSIIANFRIHPIAVLKCPFHFTRFTYVSAIGGFVRIRSPFPAVGAAAAFERRSIHVRFFSIRFRAISLANQKIFQIFFRKSLLRVQIPPRAALVIGIDEMVFHFRKRRMIADNFLRLNPTQHFPVARQKPFLLIAAVVMCRRHIGRYGNNASFSIPSKQKSNVVPSPQLTVGTTRNPCDAQYAPHQRLRNTLYNCKTGVISRYMLKSGESTAQ